jgi:penicillin-binding protein 2
MFERRLKIFLALLVVVTAVLVMRAAHVQIWQKADWQAKAEELKKRSRPVETTRGRILDVRGRPIALDRPCQDACVDYRALTSEPDPKWVEAVATERLKQRMREAFTGQTRAKRIEMVKAESQRVVSDIDRMWKRLADVTGRQLEEIEAARDDVFRKVRMRRKYIIYRNYQLALQKHENREPAPAWRRWLIDEAADVPVEDDFADLKLDEEDDAHPILKGISLDVQNTLKKRIEEYPGLVIRPGVERYYPYGDAACHLLGQLSKVTREDLAADPNVGTDELRQYLPNDLVGRTGLERLAEPLLRGSRGKIVTVEGRGGELGRVEAVPGKDVRTTIDIELQADLVHLFRNARVVNWAPVGQKRPIDVLPMHGAAVVIDVPTGEVRAMASYPTFDLNSFNEMYPKLADDDLNRPLMNRATHAALNPGSTVKPVVGLAGIADGHVGVHHGIECTGFLVINGKRITAGGRCWTESMFGQGMHHQIPYTDPHVGQHGNPTGFLDFSDAVQRSCNVYFETLGERLKMEGMAKWFNRFGIGRKTGIGLPEKPGSDPLAYRGPDDQRRFATWIAAIGQGETLATPLQMANVAATIARDGVWARPRLFSEAEGVPRPAPAPGEEDPGPDVVNLGLPREAVRAAQEGMTRVVNTEAGSGKVVRRDDLLIAGKTGTAEVGSPLKVMVRDANGEIVYEDVDEPATRPTTTGTATQPQKKRRPKMRELEPSSPQHPNPEAPWFRGFGEDGKTLKHSWFIGFAPADNPKIAFAVAVEYGGGGGEAAGLIAKELVSVLIEKQYLPRKTNGALLAQPAAHTDRVEPSTVGDEPD